jgi:hypothetical protein
MLMHALTVDPIDLDQVLDHRLVWSRLGPVESDRIGLDPRERYRGRVRHFHA